MTTRAELRICMGSACHQHGVYDLLPRVEDFLARYSLTELVELKGAFCLDHCREGVVMQLTTSEGGDSRKRLVLGVSAANLDSKLVEEVLPYLDAAASASYTD